MYSFNLRCVLWSYSVQWKNVLRLFLGALLWGRATPLLAKNTWAEPGWALLHFSLTWKDHLVPKNWKGLDPVLQLSLERPSG